jgi:hypothetical protein
MNQTATAILKQQNAILDAMSETRVMRRGTLSIQEYPARRARKNGHGVTGPYALWQGYQDGKHFSERVTGQDVVRFTGQIEARKRFELLCAQYINLGQALAQAPDAASAVEEALKKKPVRKSSGTGKSHVS